MDIKTKGGQTMSEFKGTKGKWIAEESYSIEFRQPIFNINVGEIIEGLATIWSGSNKITEESKANAHLIAHAPQMLEMLKDNLAYMEELAMLITSENWTEEFRDNWNAKTNELEQLIQQATTI